MYTTQFLQDLYAVQDEIQRAREALVRWEEHLTRAIKSDEPSRIAYYTGQVVDATEILNTVDKS